MRPPDTSVFDVFGIEDCRRILDLLVDSGEPLTQGEIANALDLRSSVASRRMAEIEQAGLVVRASSHAPYELVFRELVHRMLEIGADLAGEVAARMSAEAQALRDERRIRGMRGRALPGGARESS